MDENLLKDFDTSNMEDAYEDNATIINKIIDPTAMDFAKQRIVKPETLAFITPWHHRAYKMKIPFQFLAPVWFRISPNDQQIKIIGDHDVNVNWMKEIQQLRKESGQKIRIVPRFSVDQFSDSSHYKALFISQRERIIKHIITLVQKYDFDGITLELGYLQYDGVASLVSSFLSSLRKNLAELSKNRASKGHYHVILVLPAHESLISTKQVTQLSKWVDRFFIMTYDYSTQQSRSPGPIAPIKWVEKSISRLCSGNTQVQCSKILMGINFYGYDYTIHDKGVNAITGENFSRIIQENNVVELIDHDSMERYIEYYDSEGHHHKVYYPSEVSINQRINLAKRLGVGLGIWELGQGLDSFFNCFTESR